MKKQFYFCLSGIFFSFFLYSMDTSPGNFKDIFRKEADEKLLLLDKRINELKKQIEEADKEIEKIYKDKKGPAATFYENLWLRTKNYLYPAFFSSISFMLSFISSIFKKSR